LIFLQEAVQQVTQFLNLNKKDGGNRRFILCTNNENEICEEVTYPRVKNVIKGYKNEKKESVEGLGNNLKYFKTSFVANNRNKDQLKIDITKRCTEMLCLKEGIFNLIKEEADYKIFQQGNRYLAVYYDFANASLDELKEEMNALKGEKVLYCFTVDNHGLDKANFRGWKNIRLEANSTKDFRCLQTNFQKLRMSYGNKEYQVNAIGQLVKSVSELLAKDASNKVCVFQSPTGSGKTVMVAKFIEEIIKELPETDLCFLWVSIGKGDLHKQSKKSLERIFDGFPNVNLLEEEFFGSRNYIEQNEVVVVNWEKLYSKYASGENKGEWKNKVMRDGEGVNFIEVLETTREKRKIILIIDESHYASDAQRTSELRKIISADVTLEMSATPKIQPSAQDIAKGNAKFIYVDPKDVIEEGMIKKELIINENLEKLVDDEKTSQDIIIEAAYNKRLELKEAYTNAGSNINPLCLIQLPNAEAGVAKKEVIEAFLADKGITETNGKLAVWLSEEKSDGLDEISDFESEVEFLLFKQAIDTGWDCPRAHILVKLRDIQSYTFEVQTVGRILRMPEQMHYEDENLNTGFIFTNLQKITVQKEDYNPNIIKHLKSVRKPIYKPLLLPSYYKSRVDFGDITFSFGKTLEEVFCNAFGIEINPTMVNTAENGDKIKAKGLTTDITTYKESLLTDKKITGKEFDEIAGVLNDK
jgi:type III restriction enzyme